MELTDREKDFLQALSGTVKSTLSLVPGLGQAIAGWDAYKKSGFERNLKAIISHLNNKIDDFESFFSDDWFKSQEGQQFTRKVFDSAFDMQMEDKQELFINALINGALDKETTNLEKLKFVDMLRNLSLASHMVLADIHKMFIDDVRGPGRNADLISAFPLINPSIISKELSATYHPYLVTSAISEMESQGLFSRTGEWRKKNHDGSFVEGAGFSTDLCYTDFTARFVEFVTLEEEINKVK